jgi:glycosyltransferase involved in cell wall biosynthesis
MKVSIIIPALNEEASLPQLLASIGAQDFPRNEFEVILADAHSTDRTREIGAEYGCVIVDGGLPAAGRNAGAKVARGEFLLFLDAAVVRPPGFIRGVYGEMQKRYIDLATCEIRPMSDFQLDRVIHRMMNLAVILNLWIDPKAFGFCIFVTKRLFERINGFDESIYVAEDNDFVKRGSAFRNLRFLNDVFLSVSVRRFEKEGRFEYMKKGIKLNLHRTFKGEIRSDRVVKYEFDAYDRPPDPEEKTFLDKIEAKLLTMEAQSKRRSVLARQRAKVNSRKELKSHLEEYSSMYEELDKYLSKK